jgi:hypothetical protein
MNYDTVLPNRLRVELQKRPKPKKLKVLWKIAIAVVLLIGLRHLNTAPQRQWEKAWRNEAHWEDHYEYQNGYPVVVPEKAVYHQQVDHKWRVYTAEDLFGSSYRGERDGQDIGLSSKNFGDIFLQTFGVTDGTRATLRAIER